MSRTAIESITTWSISKVSVVDIIFNHVYIYIVDRIWPSVYLRQFEKFASALAIFNGLFAFFIGFAVIKRLSDGDKFNKFCKESNYIEYWWLGTADAQNSQFGSIFCNCITRASFQQPRPKLDSYTWQIKNCSLYRRNVRVRIFLFASFETNVNSRKQIAIFFVSDKKNSHFSLNFSARNPCKWRKSFFCCCCAECRISLWIFAKNRIESKARTRYQRNGITLTAQMTLHHRNREKVERWKGRGKKRKRTIYSENIEMRTITVCMMLTIPRWRWVIMLTRANQRLRIEKLCSVMKKKTISAANLHPVLCSLSSSIRCRKCGNAL